MFEHRVEYTVLSGVNPVSQGADRAPTYAIACSGTFGNTIECVGRVTLELPPGPGNPGPPGNALGEGAFNIEAGKQANVTVKLNDAGVVALAQNDQRASVLVLSGIEAGPEDEGQNVRFGWQQVLGP